MTISVNCSCGRTLDLPDALAGKGILGHFCQKKIKIPSLHAEEATSSPKTIGDEYLLREPEVKQKSKASAELMADVLTSTNDARKTKSSKPKIDGKIELDIDSELSDAEIGKLVGKATKEPSRAFYGTKEVLTGLFFALCGAAVIYFGFQVRLIIFPGIGLVMYGASLVNRGLWLRMTKRWMD